MATHPSILACRIPWTEEPGGLQSTGSHRGGRDCVTHAFTLFCPFQPLLLSGPVRQPPQPVHRRCFVCIRMILAEGIEGQ